MLEDLQKYEKLGNKEELLLILFEGLKPSGSQLIENLRKFCVSKKFSIARSFKGILGFLEFISFVEIKNNEVITLSSNFNPLSFKQETYLSKFHFFSHFFKSLKKENILDELFNGENIKQKITTEVNYYIKDYQFPVKYFSIRNLLISTGFIFVDNKHPGLLFINPIFATDFENEVLKKVIATNEKKRKFSLEELKKRQIRNEENGRQAEIFALNYEKTRLHGHPNLEKVMIISEEYSNAGFDIISFNDNNSIVIDRFVEVKSFGGEFSFFWSKNEIEKAKELKGKYYLYIIDRSRIQEINYKPQILQDPFKKIFETDFWTTEPESWKISYKAKYLP